MQKITGNEEVSITLIGKLENGEIFESSGADVPLNLSLGSNTLFPALERAMIGMEPGQTRTIQLPPDQAFGPHHKDLVQTLERSSFSTSITPVPGMVLALKIDRNGESQQVPATVVSVNEQTVVVDYNHPLAGKPLIFTVTLHSIVNFI